MASNLQIELRLNSLFVWHTIARNKLLPSLAFFIGQPAFQNSFPSSSKAWCTFFKAGPEIFWACSFVLESLSGSGMPKNLSM